MIWRKDLCPHTPHQPLDAPPPPDRPPPPEFPLPPKPPPERPPPVKPVFSIYSKTRQMRRYRSRYRRKR